MMMAKSFMLKRVIQEKSILPVLCPRSPAHFNIPFRASWVARLGGSSSIGSYIAWQYSPVCPTFGYPAFCPTHETEREASIPIELSRGLTSPWKGRHEKTQSQEA